MLCLEGRIDAELELGAAAELPAAVTVERIPEGGDASGWRGGDATFVFWRLSTEAAAGRDELAERMGTPASPVA